MTARWPSPPAAGSPWRRVPIRSPNRSPMSLTFRTSCSAPPPACAPSRPRPPPGQLDGWKQAWLLPTGSSGLVTLTYQPESLYRDAVAGGLAELALTVIVAFSLGLRRARRALEWPEPDPYRQRQGARRPWWLGIPRWLRMAVLIVAMAVTLAGA